VTIGIDRKVGKKINRKVFWSVIIISIVMIPVGSLLIHFSGHREQGRQMELKGSLIELLIEFEPIKYTLEVNCIGGGVAYMTFITDSNSSDESSHIYTNHYSYYKEEFCQYYQLFLEPYASPGWEFSHFSGSLNFTKDDYIKETETTRTVRTFNILMDSDKQITLHFEKI
jgi:hypothetical protein